MDSKVLQSILNPIRMRIIQTILGSETATARSISENMPDIPTASLYRHLNKLVEDGVLQICAENKIRGTIEKVYSLNGNPFKQLEQYAESGGKEALSNMFYAFTMSMLADFQGYLKPGDHDLLRDKVGFRSYPLYMSDEECDEFTEDLKKAILKVNGNKADGKRKLRKFSFVLMPVKDK